MRYTIVVFFTFSNTWQRKTRAERHAYEQQHLQPLLSRYADKLSFRFFNAGLFGTESTNFLIVETDDLKPYYFFTEELRDNPMLGEGYVHLTKIMTGYEDGFPQFEKETAAMEVPA